MELKSPATMIDGVERNSLQTELLNRERRDRRYSTCASFTSAQSGSLKQDNERRRLGIAGKGMKKMRGRRIRAGSSPINVGVRHDNQMTGGIVEPEGRHYSHTVSLQPHTRVAGISAITIAAALFCQI